MKFVDLSSRVQRVAITASVAVVAVVASLLAAQPVHAVGAGTTWPTEANAVPFTNTPNITNGTVFAITQVGNLVIVGGSFTTVQDHGSSVTVTRNHVLAFDVSTGVLSQSFAPSLDGTVEAVDPGPTPNTVYVAGAFSNVNGVKSKGITLLDTTTGAIVSGYKPPALNGIVYTIASAGGRTYIAGSFTLAGSAARGGLAALVPTTGALDPSVSATVQFAGHHNYNGTGANGAVGPRAMAVNPAGTTLVVIGNFKTADGLPRDQIAMLDLPAPAPATGNVTVEANWATKQYTAACSSGSFDTYVTDVQYSADGSYFAVTATGGASTNNTDGTPSLCDSAARWESSATGSSVLPTWVDFTGRDTLWSVAIAGNAIYVGGHERWLNNSNGKDSPGAGAVPRPGIAALDPLSGVPLLWNPGRSPRGAGAYALFVGTSGLYVGSDTDYIGASLYKHQKIAYFPLAGGLTAAATTTAALPSNLYRAGPLPSSNALDFRAIDGSTVGPLTPITTSIAWGTTRGAFMAGNSIFYGNSTGSTFSRASFDGSTVGTPVVLDPYDDPYWDSVQTGSGQTYRGTKSGYYGEMAGITGAFYSNGRLYYSQSGKSALYWRWFSPDSGTIGSQEFNVSTSGFNFGSTVAGMVLSGSTLYYGNKSDGTLHTRPFANGSVAGTDTTFSSATNWAARSLFLYGGQSGQNALPTASATSSCTGLKCSFDGSSSTDSDGSIASYDWDFGDGTPHGSGVTPSHTYAPGGPYTATLTVTDNRGGVSPTPWSEVETVQNALPTASATSSCSGLDCSFDGSSSTDPDGSIASYAWTFGDGGTDSAANPTHHYTDSGTYPVTLTVTDDNGGISSPAWSGTVTVPTAQAPVGFVGEAGYNNSSANPTVVVPGGVSAGDTELLFVSTATNGLTTNLPTGLSPGWTQIARKTNAPLETTVFQRAATAGDSGKTVTVPLASAVRVDVQLVVYSGVAAGAPVLATAGDTVTTASHTTPAVTVGSTGSWVLSYWADKATTVTTSWDLPAAVIARGTGFGAGGGHVDSAIGDSGAAVSTGSYPGQTATAGTAGGKADMISVVLRPDTA